MAPAESAQLPGAGTKRSKLLITTESTPAPATTREQRGLTLYREHGYLIEEVASDFYLVPSQDGERFRHVDYLEESCDCPDFTYRGLTCVHIFAVGVKLAKRRAKVSRCDGCGERFPRRDLFEVGDDNLTFFEGDELCRPCAIHHGVL